MKRLWQFLSAVERRREVKTIIIGFVILVTTFVAIILVGYLTSPNPLTVTTAPRITVSRFANQLTASVADQEIATWQYVGPKSNSFCQPSLFREVVGFRQNYQEGNSIQLEFERDNQKYYCFRAIAKQSGLSGYQYYLVANLPRPVIAFQQTDAQLVASLHQTQSGSDYIQSSWQYVHLASEQAACDETAFAADLAQIVNDNLVYLDTVFEDRIWCFRVAHIDGDYFYAKKSVLINPPDLDNPEFSNELEIGDELTDTNDDPDVETVEVSELEITDTEPEIPDEVDSFDEIDPFNDRSNPTTPYWR